MPRVEEPGAAHMDTGRLPRTVEAYLTALNLDTLAAEGLAPQEQQALAALQAAAAAAAPPVLTGTRLFEQLQQAVVLTTGCDSIDHTLLHSGLRSGQVVEFCGESATGKTQLCLAAAAHAARQGLRVVYIDTSNALGGRRLEQLVAAQSELPGAAQAQAVDPLKFIEVRRCYDVHALLRTLDDLTVQQARQRAQQPQQDGGGAGGAQDVRQQQAPGVQQQQAPGAQQQPAQQAAAAGGAQRRRLEDLPISLLVVDCLSALITPVLGGGGGQHSQGHALLTAAAVALKALAASSHAAVLVTNHMVGGSDERRQEKRPAMGESWRNQPHARIQLWRPPPGAGPEPARCTAALRASSLLPAGATAHYYLTPAGLSSHPPPPAAAAGPEAMQH